MSVKGLFKIATRMLPDKLYLRIEYFRRMKKILNLKNPKTFNEKLQWLKLYDRKPEYIRMVDKYEAKKYIAEQVGQEHTVPTIGVWDKFEDIDFEGLPDKFVLKCTHDSGGLVICQDKKQFNKEQARKKIQQSLQTNYYYHSREWPYKHVPPRIICEKFMTDAGNELSDYKVHNFNGEPMFVLVCRDRFSEYGLTEDFFTIQWERIEVKRPLIPNATKKIPKPELLEQMLELSRVLAKGIPFVRTDFYVIDKKLYVGEITFFPASGCGKFIPEKYDRIFGDKIVLPEKTIGKD